MKAFLLMRILDGEVETCQVQRRFETECERLWLLTIESACFPRKHWTSAHSSMLIHTGTADLSVRKLIFQHNDPRCVAY